jgi:hypothetical protein
MLLLLLLFCSLDNVLQLLLIIVSNFGDERDEILPSDVPLRLRGAADKQSDSSIFAIYTTTIIVN